MCDNVMAQFQARTQTCGQNGSIGLNNSAKGVEQASCAGVYVSSHMTKNMELCNYDTELN